MGTRGFAPALYFEGFDTEEALEKLREIFTAVKIPPKNIVARYEETKSFLNLVRRHYENPVMRVPMKFYAYAVSVYVLGFEEAAIFYSALSVELTLLRSAISNNSAKVLEAHQEHNLTFYWLIHNAEILDDKHKAVADSVRMMRDCYVHFQNQLLFSDVGTLPHAKWLEGVPEEQVRKLMEIDHAFRSEIDEVFPIAEALVTPKQLNFMRQRRELMEELVRDELKKYTLSGRTDPNLLSTLILDLAANAQSQDALDTLRWSMQLLLKPQQHGSAKPGAT